MGWESGHSLTWSSIQDLTGYSLVVDQTMHLSGSKVLLQAHAVVGTIQSLVAVDCSHSFLAGSYTGLL